MRDGKILDRIGLMVHRCQRHPSLPVARLMIKTYTF